MKLFNYVKKKILNLYVYITFSVLRSCAYIDKISTLIFRKHKITVGTFILILLNSINLLIILLYMFVTSIVVLLFLSDNLKSFLVRILIILAIITLNYILIHYDILLYYKIWRIIILMFITFYQIKDRILDFISKSSNIYRSKKFTFFLTIINEIIRGIIDIFAKNLNKQYNKAKNILKNISKKKKI